MRVRINTDASLAEDEIVINCAELTDEIVRIEKLLSEMQEEAYIEGFDGETDYRIRLGDILFFETEDGLVFAHTADSCRRVKQRLYELENRLPSNFIRISKSAIMNKNRISSITKNFTSSSLVCFQGSYKQVYVSRKYLKLC